MNHWETLLALVLTTKDDLKGLMAYVKYIWMCHFLTSLKK